MRTQNISISLHIAIILLVTALFPTTLLALTPIARYDVVPNQRIVYGSTFKFGVVAFSKADISSVKFTISGQGYSGGVKSASAMTYNDRTNVYEYWVPIASSEFSTNGAFTVTAVVTGRDGDSRNLGSLTLNVDATNSLAQPKAWVSTSGNDSTGKVNNQAQPFSTVEAAINAVQSANSGTADGAIVYLKEGTYTIGSGSTKTSNEWLTITKDSSASESKVVLVHAGSALDTHLARLKDITIKYSGDYAIAYTIADHIWFDGCTIIGRGRQYANSNPIAKRTWDSYWTGNYISNLDMAIHKGLMSRGNNISTISDDANQNTMLVINDRIDDIDPSSNPTSPHADAYQMHVTNNPSPDNYIVYGMRATNLHQQGIFARPSSEGSPVKHASNIAFVNNFIECRTGYANELQGIWDHLLIWQNTFATSKFRIYKDTTTSAFSFKNVSIVGNYFYEFYDAQTHGAAFDIGNTNGNETAYNHYRYSIDDGFGTTYNTYSPDTNSPHTDTVGTQEIDLSDKVNYVHFGFPLNSDSVLVNKVLEVRVPGDNENVSRGSVSDVGAFETTSAKSPPAPPSLY